MPAKKASNTLPTSQITHSPWRRPLKVITGFGQAAMNIADTRTWTTLPKEFQVCRIPTPTNQVVTLTASGSAQKSEIKVEQGSVNLIYVKAIDTVSPLIVNQVKLKTGTATVAHAEPK